MAPHTLQEKRSSRPVTYLVIFSWPWVIYRKKAVQKIRFWRFNSQCNRRRAALSLAEAANLHFVRVEHGELRIRRGVAAAANGAVARHDCVGLAEALKFYRAW